MTTVSTNSVGPDTHRPVHPICARCVPLCGTQGAQIVQWDGGCTDGSGARRVMSRDGGRHRAVESGAFTANELVALAVAPGVGAVAVGDHGGEARWPAREAFASIQRVELDVGPRWVWWTSQTARLLVEAGVRPSRCWDLDAVHRLLHGGWRAGPGATWAAVHGLDPDDVPTVAAVDLFSAADDPERPVRPDGHLAPTWIDASWCRDLDHLATWASLALSVSLAQTHRLESLESHPAAAATARSESAAALLAVELGHDGLPLDIEGAERIIASFIGPRPRDAHHERRLAQERDELVLRHLPRDLRDGVDLRNPANVKSLLRRAGIEVDDTRAWRLERLRDAHPVVDALLSWRTAERMATTFGYRWLDEHVDDGRLRGTWSCSDGAAGRMTATAGLHNLPADLRPAVVADAGHCFVRADLGQIEPRILAAVSGDDTLVAATREADMYAPVAQRLGVSRETAKVAVLGAMYGQTTGHGAAALRGLDAAYPTAMRHLTDAAHEAEGGNDLRTRGGRLVRMSGPDDLAASDPGQRSRAAARGRSGRNAVVQGAAAE